MAQLHNNALARAGLLGPTWATVARANTAAVSDIDRGRYPAIVAPTDPPLSTSDTLADTVTQVVDRAARALNPMGLTRTQRARAARLVAELASLGPTLPGTVVRRQSRCGKPTCRCRADPPQLHGPYWWWTRSVDGKTVTRMLSDELYTRYQHCFDDHRRTVELLAELDAIGLAALEADPAYGKRRTRGPTSPRAVDNPRSKRT